MLPRKVYAMALLAALPALAFGQTPAAWATSGNEPPAPATSPPPAIIASTRPGQTALPAEARLPLPDDGLRQTPAQPTTATTTARAPGQMPHLTVPGSSGHVRPAVYTTQDDGKPGDTADSRPPPVIPVSSTTPGTAEPRPALQPVVESASQPVLPGSALSVAVVGPATVAPGQNVPCKLIVRNAGSLVVASVNVDLPIPPGLRVVMTKPEALRDGDRVTWQLGNLEAGGERTLEFEVQAAHPGDLQLGPTARFTAAMALRTSIVRPPFALTVSNPDNASVGEKVVLQIQVGNHTGSAVRRVGLRCELTAGLVHPQGQVIEADLGEDLAPGQVRTIQLETQARQPGRQLATLVATADGGLSARATAGVQVGEPTLTLTTQGPRQIGLGQEASLTLEVANPGSRPSGPVRVTQSLPQGVEFLSASTGGMFDPVAGAVTWALPELGGEQRQTLTYRLRARQAGDWALASSLQVEGMSPVRATHAVQIEATPAVSLEINALDDVVLAGRDTTYDLRVYNAGPAPARGVRVVVHVPDHLVPVSGDGPARWQIRGQEVYFEPLAELRGRADAVYRLRVRGARPGQGQLRAEVHAAGLSRPQKQEVTTTVQAAR